MSDENTSKPAVNWSSRVSNAASTTDVDKSALLQSLEGLPTINERKIKIASGPHGDMRDSTGARVRIQRREIDPDDVNSLIIAGELTPKDVPLPESGEYSHAERLHVKAGLSSEVTAVTRQGR